MTPALQKPKAIIWDWDGTIVSTYEVIRHALLLTLQNFNITGEKYDYAMECAGKRAMRDFFPQVFGDGWKNAGEDFYQNFEATHLEKLELIPMADKVIETISRLHPDIYQAVVSNKRGDLLRREASHLKLDKYFKKIIGATDAVRDKPDTAPLLLALESSGIQPGADIYIIGDSTPDLELAANANCRAIFFGENKIDEKYNSLLVAKVENHAQLKNIISNLNQRSRTI